MIGEQIIDLGEYKVEIIYGGNGHLMVTIVDGLGEPIEMIEITNEDE